MASSAARIPKPDFYNVAIRNWQKDILKSAIVGLIGGVSYYVFVSKQREKKIDDYFANVDPDAEFEKMREMGIFTSAPPDWVLEERARKQKEKAKNKK